MDPLLNLIADIDNGMSLEAAMIKYNAHDFKGIDAQLCSALNKGKYANALVRNKLAFYRAKLDIQKV